VLEVPKDIDPANFIGKLVNFDRETKVKINKKKYVIEPCMENLKPIALLTNKLKIIKPVANLKLCEYKKHKSIDQVVESGSSRISFCENVGDHHPLLGAEYKNKIVLDEKIKEKLDCTIDNVLKKMKKEKKHKEKSRSSEKRNEELDKSVFTLLESHDADKSKNSPKKTKKSKHNSIVNSTAIGGFQLPIFEFDVSGIVGKEEQETEDEEENAVQDEFEVKKERPSEHKKKKKKAGKSFTESIADTEDSMNEENEVQNEFQVKKESSNKHKKKKEKADGPFIKSIEEPTTDIEESMNEEFEAQNKFEVKKKTPDKLKKKKQKADGDFIKPITDTEESMNEEYAAQNEFEVKKETSNKLKKKKQKMKKKMQCKMSLK
jgi:hypothetical protein